MMQDTQRESVGFNAGTACLIPFDVGGFDSQGDVPQADVKPTDGTGIPVHGQDTHAELRITWGTGHRLDLQVEPHRIRNIVVDGLWEVLIEEVTGDGDKQPWILMEYRINRCGEPAMDRIFEQFTLFGVVVALPGND